MSQTQTCPHCGASLTLDESHADAILFDEELGRQIARSFIMSSGSRFKNAGEYEDWLASKLELNRFERFMSRPWGRAS